jgi:hypothetical protein
VSAAVVWSGPTLSFERPSDRTNVIAILRQIMTVCRELKIREGRVGMTASLKGRTSVA